MGISDGPAYGDSNVVEFRTGQIKPIKQLFESIKNKLPDTSLLFDRSCMKILQVDTAQTFLVDVRLDGENFEHYYCNPDQENDYIEINLNAENLNAVFKSVTKDDSIFTFTYSHNNSTVNIMFQNPKKDEIKSFDIPIQNPESEDDFKEITQDMIDEYDYCMSMPTTDLTAICKTFKNVNCDVIQIIHDNVSLRFTSPGDTKVSVTRVGTVSDENATDSDKLIFSKLPKYLSESEKVDDEGPYSGKFKFSTFHEFSKSQGNADNKIVELMLGKGRPIILHYEIGDLGEMLIAMAAMTEDNEEED